MIIDMITFLVIWIGCFALFGWFQYRGYNRIHKKDSSKIDVLEKIMKDRKIANDSREL